MWWCPADTSNSNSFQGFGITAFLRVRTVMALAESSDMCVQHDWRLANWIICWVGCGLFLLLALLCAPSQISVDQCMTCIAP